MLDLMLVGGAICLVDNERDSSLLNSSLIAFVSVNFSEGQMAFSHMRLSVITTRRWISEHITPVLTDLYWLPVQYHIQYKLAAITFKVQTTQEPSYLHELVQSNAFAERAFRHSAPTVWNSLPQYLKTYHSNFTTEL